MIEIFKSEIGDYIEDCIQKTKKEFIYILEDEKQLGVFVSQSDKYHLEIENSSKSNVYFLQNEECVMNQKDGKQIDWLIFNKEVLCFVENKSNVGKRRRSKSKREAYAQLENAFIFYKNVIENGGWTSVLGLVVIKPTGITRTPSAKQSSLKAKFKIKYNIEVLEQNILHL